MATKLAQSLLAKSNRLFQKKEKDLYQIFKKAWNGYIERIEPKFKGGIPDVLIVTQSEVVIFLELKKAVIDGHNLTMDIKQSQKIWHMKYPAISYVLIQCDKRFYLIEKNMVNLLKNRMTKIELINVCAKDTARIQDITKWFNLL
jgi:hypothetical protein